MVEGLRQVFVEQYKEKELVYPQVFDVTRSRKQFEVDYSVASIGMLSSKQEGVAMSYEDFVPGYSVTYTHTSYAKGIRITRELMDDELYGVISKRSKALARSARYRKEYDHARVFYYAATTAASGGVFTGGDGKALLDTAHPLIGVAGATYGNTPSSATTLSATALNTALLSLRKVPDDQNMLISLRPAVLLVPPDLEVTAWEILNSQQKPYTSDNDRNFWDQRLKLVVWDQIGAQGSTTAWFVLCDKSECAPISFDRVPVEFDNDGDFDTKDLKISAYTRYSCGFSDWRWVYGYSAAVHSWEWGGRDNRRHDGSTLTNVIQYV